MIRTAMVGLGKMGLSHLAIVRAHPEHRPRRRLRRDRLPDRHPEQARRASSATPTSTACSTPSRLDALVVATPSKLHAPMVQQGARARACTSSARSPSCSTSPTASGSSSWRAASRCVTQVGYHYRFVGAFKEAARHRPVGRPRRDPPRSRRGVRAGRAAPQGRDLALDQERRRRRALRLRLPRDRPRELHRRRRRRRWAASSATASSRATSTTRSTARFHFAGGASGQLCVNWSDESFRKMSTKISVWGTSGRLTADRQECQLYLREHARRAARRRHAAGRCATRPTCPTRSGSTCAARNTRRRSTTSPRA